MIEINNGQPIPLMWYIFILLFFRILALENVAKILTTGPRLGVRRNVWKANWTERQVHSDYSAKFRCQVFKILLLLKIFVYIFFNLRRFCDLQHFTTF